MDPRPKALKPWLPPQDRPARVLLVRLSALGDVLHALPVLSALRRHLPTAHLAWAVEDRAEALLRHRSDLDQVVVFPRKALQSALKRPHAAPRVLRPFVRELRGDQGDGRRGFDLALDLQGNLKSGLVTRLSGARTRVGLDRRDSKEGNHLFLHRGHRPAAKWRHKVERNLALASACFGVPLPYVAPGFPLPAQARDAAQERLAGAGIALDARADGASASGEGRGNYIVLHPGTSGFGSFKRWPTDRWGALARRLHADHQSVVITAGPGEGELARAIVAEAPHARVVEPASLLELAALLEPARLLVAADTGPLHLAALLHVPVLGLYGPKDPAVYGPYGVDVQGPGGGGTRSDGARFVGGGGVLDVLTQPDVACRPCTLRRCADPLCMRTLEPDRVHAAARLVLAR